LLINLPCNYPIQKATSKSGKELLDEMGIAASHGNNEIKTAALSSSSERKNESVILLRVHGITEAGELLLLIGKRKKMISTTGRMSTDYDFVLVVAT